MYLKKLGKLNLRKKHISMQNFMNRKLQLTDDFQNTLEMISQRFEMTQDLSNNTSLLVTL